MRPRTLPLVLVLLLWATPVSAQPSLTLVWDMLGEVPAAAQAFIYRYFLDGGVGVILNAVVCSNQNPLQVTTCSAIIPPPAIGTHTVEVNAENQYGVSDKSVAVTFKYPAVPGIPQNLRIEKGGSASP
jgi:hypothetical protein